MKRRSFLKALAGVAGAAAAQAVVAIDVASGPDSTVIAMATTGGRLMRMRQTDYGRWWDIVEVMPDGSELPFGGVSAEHLVEIGLTPEEELRRLCGWYRPGA
jgi:hypothetical protein